MPKCRPIMKAEGHTVCAHSTPLNGRAAVTGPLSVRRQTAMTTTIVASDAIQFAGRSGRLVWRSISERKLCAGSPFVRRGVVPQSHDLNIEQATHSFLLRLTSLDSASESKLAQSRRLPRSSSSAIEEDRTKSVRSVLPS